LRTVQQIRNIAIGAYALPFLFRFAYALIDGRPGDLILGASLVGVAVWPVILHFCGVKWARYVVGIFSVIALLINLILPMAQHAIDRTATFWFIWSILLLVFSFSSFMSFKGNGPWNSRVWFKALSNAKAALRACGTMRGLRWCVWD